MDATTVAIDLAKAVFEQSFAMRRGDHKTARSPGKRNTHARDDDHTYLRKSREWPTTLTGLLATAFHAHARGGSFHAAASGECKAGKDAKRNTSRNSKGNVAEDDAQGAA